MTLQQYQSTHTKLCKKIIQLTKVIYLLNTKNDEYELKLMNNDKYYVESHQYILRQCADQIITLNNQLQLQNNKIHTIESGYQLQLQSLNELYQKYQDECSKQQTALHEQYDNKINDTIAQSNHTLHTYENIIESLKSQFITKITSFTNVLDSMKAAHENELNTILQMEKTKYNTLLDSKLQCDDTICTLQNELNMMKQQLTNTSTISIQAENELRHELHVCQQTIASLNEKLTEVTQHNTDYRSQLQSLTESNDKHLININELNNELKQRIELHDAYKQTQHTLNEQSVLQYHTLRSQYSELDNEVKQMKLRYQGKCDEHENYIRANNNEHTNAQAVLQSQIDSLTSDQLSLQQQLDGLQKQYTDQCAQYTLVHNELEERKLGSTDRDKKHIDMIKKLNHDIALLHEQTNDIQHSSQVDRALIGADLARETERLRLLQNEYNELNNHSIHVADQLVALTNQYTTLQQQNTVATNDFHDEINQLNNRLMTVNDEYHRLQMVHTIKTQECDTLADELQSLRQQYESCNKQYMLQDSCVAQLNQSIAQLNNQLNIVQNELTESHNNIELLDNKLLAVQHDNATLHNQYTDEHTLHQQLQQKHTDLLLRYNTDTNKLRQQLDQLSTQTAHETKQLTQSNEYKHTQLATQLHQLQLSYHEYESMHKSTVEKHSAELQQLNEYYMIDRDRLRQQWITQTESTVEHINIDHQKYIDTLNIQHTAETQHKLSELAAQHQHDIDRLQHQHQYTIQQVNQQHEQNITSIIASTKQQCSAQHSIELSELQSTLTQQNQLKQQVIQVERNHERKQYDDTLNRMKTAFDDKVCEYNSTLDKLNDTVNQLNNTTAQLNDHKQRVEQLTQQLISRLDEQKLQLSSQHADELRHIVDIHHHELQQLQSTNHQSVDQVNQQCHKLRIELNQMTIKYEQRPSRPDDIERMKLLECKCIELDKSLRRAIDDMKYYKLELSNREHNFNKLFGNNPVIATEHNNTTQPQLLNKPASTNKPASANHRSTIPSLKGIPSNKNRRTDTFHKTMNDEIKENLSTFQHDIVRLPSVK